MGFGKTQFLAAVETSRRQKKILLATVSGIASTKPALIRYFDRKVKAVSLITTKSFQVAPNPGNREPIITELSPGNFGNSVGLRNPGMETALEEVRQLRADGLEALLNISVSASNPEDFITLVKGFAPYADSLELNFSCPHASAGYGASIGCDPEISALYMEKIRAAVGLDCPALIFPKMTPNTDKISEIAKRLVEAGADGISAINTVGPEQYFEPNSHAVILNNKLEGRGGKSGSWIHEEALRVITEIREAVGPEIPIIGMGGVSTAEQAAALYQAGADFIGVGSALGTVAQQQWPEYLLSVQEGAEALLQGKVPVSDETRYIRRNTAMDFTPFTITEKRDLADGISTITLDGTIDGGCSAGEYVFIWIPGIGEKPFSVGLQSPLTFVIKDRGHFTHELLKCSAGDTLYLRGAYGAEVAVPDKPKALLAAGGTGIAVLPSLAEKLKTAGVEMKIYFGTSSAEGEEIPLQKVMEEYGELIIAADHGVPGRILGILEEQETDLAETACFFVGPEPFMARGASIAKSRGASSENIMLSMERSTLCGVGMCGECACGDLLTCQHGTFITRAFLEQEEPGLLQ